MNQIVQLSSIRVGGTAKHVLELSNIFSDYNHLFAGWNDIISIAENSKPALLHIHTLYMIYPDGSLYYIIPIDNYDPILQSYVSLNIPIYITIHDYQWLYPAEPILIKETLGSVLEQDHIKLVEKIMNYASCIIFPSENVRDNYLKYLKNIKTKIVTVPHCDIPIRMEQLYIPSIDNSKTINIAFVGDYISFKGSKLFEELIEHFFINNAYGYNYTFHIYGRKAEESNIPDTTKYNIKYNGAYDENNIIKQLHNDNIHLLCFFSIAEETYSYSLSIMINSGIPMVYLNRGALQNRIYNCGQARFFCANTICDILQATYNAIAFIINNQGIKDYVEMPTSAVVNDWYKENYPSMSSKNT